MIESATLTACTRDAKRRLTAHRITVRAQELALEHGLDGFTMDDLAAHAEVSRRTLFNYFPGKDDAVLGGMPDLDPAVLESFAAGGPSGNLVDDIATVLIKVLEESPETHADAVRAREVMRVEPRLLAVAHERLQTYVESCMPLVETREGAAFDRTRTDMALALILVCFHVAMDRYLGEGGDSDDLASLFTESLATARDLLR